MAEGSETQRNIEADDILSRSAGPKLRPAKQADKPASQDAEFKAAAANKQHQDPGPSDPKTKFVVAGGNYQAAAIGPQTHIKGDDYAGATIINNYFSGEASNKEPLSKASARKTETDDIDESADTQSLDSTTLDQAKSIAENVVTSEKENAALRTQKTTTNLRKNIQGYGVRVQRFTRHFEFGEEWKGRFSDQKVSIVQFNQDDVEKYEYAVDVLTDLEHENIVHFIKEIPEIRVILTEFCDGTLKDYVAYGDGKRAELSDLIRMAAQIASGMDFLYRNKFVHCGLRAANVAVTANLLCKISGFGMTRHVGMRGGCSVGENDILARWAAQEVFEKGYVSFKSDVWSFGVLLWEIVTRGDKPYPGLEDDSIAFELRSGHRMLQPKQCPSGVYFDIMMPCWNEDPDARPTFECLEKTLLSYDVEADQKDSSNKASSSQQRGMKPSSLRKPTNEDKLTEQSRSILHHTSAANIPPPTPDPSNRSKLRQQPVERSSPKRPADVKTLTERFQSALRLPSASKKVASKEDPNNHSNLRQLPVEEASTKRSTNETTLPERFQSALRIPSTSKQVPSKEGIVIFDKKSNHLQLFNPADNTLKQMQSFNKDMMSCTYTAVTLHDFVYALMETKSVHRLKFSDERANWERMPDMIDDHGRLPPATVMSGSIYVAGGSSQAYTNAVEEFDPSSNKWSSLEEKTLTTTSNALVVAQGLIYSIGGYSKEGDYLKEVERFDAVSSTWTFVAPMKEVRHFPAAVEFNGKIFVLGGYNYGQRLSSVEIYDPSTNVWSVMKNNMLKPRWVFSAFVINGDIYAVGGNDKEENSVERYSSEKDVWEEVLIQTEREIYIRASTKIQI